jgi:hypothetical protein
MTQNSDFAETPFLQNADALLSSRLWTKILWAVQHSTRKSRQSLALTADSFLLLAV